MGDAQSSRLVSCIWLGGVAPEVEAHYSPHIPRGKEGGKKKNFPEKHVTQISYTIVHGRKLTHTFVCTKQKLCGGPEIWLHSRWRSQIISKLKNEERERERGRGREPRYHEKHLFFGTSTAKSVCGIRVRRQKKKDRRTHWQQNSAHEKARHVNRGVAITGN